MTATLAVMWVRETTGPGRVPRVGDRVYWAGDAVRRRREGTVTAVYDDPRGAPFGALFDVDWDPPSADDPQPWGGVSQGLPVSQLRRPGWAWVDERDGNPRSGAVRERPRDSSPTPALLFPLGRVLATPGALQAFEESAADPVRYLARHATGDWGELDAEDRAANDRALRTGGRLLSAYRLPSGERIWIITEADRSLTSIILPTEY